MKLHSALLILFLLVLCPIETEAQELSLDIGITYSIKAGNSEELVKYMNDTVELFILDKGDYYNKNMAQVVLSNFFNLYDIKDFIIRHHGSRNDAQYAICRLATDKGDFRIYFLLKAVNGNKLIHQMRIEKEKENE